MRLVCVLFTFENNTGHTDGRTDGRTDTTSYRDATAHLKSSNVLTDGSSGQIRGGIENFGDAKVSQFDDVIFGDEDVLRLDVTMKDFQIVNVFDRQDLIEVNEKMVEWIERMDELVILIGSAEEMH